MPQRSCRRHSTAHTNSGRGEARNGPVFHRCAAAGIPCRCACRVARTVGDGGRCRRCLPPPSPGLPNWCSLSSTNCPRRAFSGHADELATTGRARRATPRERPRAMNLLTVRTRRGDLGKRRKSRMAAAGDADGGTSTVGPSNAVWTTQFGASLLQLSRKIPADIRPVGIAGRTVGPRHRGAAPAPVCSWKSFEGRTAYVGPARPLMDTSLNRPIAEHGESSRAPRRRGPRRGRRHRGSPSSS